MRKEPKPEDVALGKRIRWVRENVAKVKPGTFAEPIGVTRQAVVNWERGHGADRKKLEKLAIHYGIRYEWLTTNRGAPISGDARPAETPSMQQPSNASEIERLKARLGEQFARLMRADEGSLKNAIDTIDGIIHALPPERSRIKRMKEKSSPIRT